MVVQKILFLATSTFKRTLKVSTTVVVYYELGEKMHSYYLILFFDLMAIGVCQGTTTS